MRPASKVRKPKPTRTVQLFAAFYNGQMIPASVAVHANQVWTTMSQVGETPLSTAELQAKGITVKPIK